jgi:hypothetical protein
MVKVAAVLLAGLSWAPLIARAQTTAPPPPPSSSPAAASAAAPAWKQIYENSQTLFYVDAGSVQQTGQYNVAALLEYKIPRVIGGVQVWSAISRMKISCDEKRMATVDNTLYALRMGTGKVVISQTTGDLWHPPQPGSLGEIIWNAVCEKK